MNLQENNKLSEKLKKLIDENGFYQVQKMIGVNTTELVKLSGIPIDSVMANQILTENIVSKKIPTSYKNFEIQCDEFQGVVYWVGKFETKHYQSGMYEIVSFMATPFWDGESRVPIQLDYLELRSVRNDAIIQQIEGDGSFFESLDINIIFKNVDELLNWYEKFYLPKVHKIIMKKLLPEVYDYLDTVIDIGMRRLDEDISRIKSLMSDIIVVSDGVIPYTGGNVFPIKGEKYQLVQKDLSDFNYTRQDIYDNDEGYEKEQDMWIEEIKKNFEKTPPIPEEGDGLHRIVAAKELGHKTILMWKKI